VKPAIRPALLIGIACAALMSWGIEFLVQASSTGPSVVPASLGPSSQPPPPSRAPGALKDRPFSPMHVQERSLGSSPSFKEDAAESAVEGPALGVPREVLGMLELRKRDLDRREESVQQAEGRLAMLKAELEQVLTKIEALEKRRKDAKDKIDKAAVEKKAKQEQNAIDLRHQHQAQLAKIFETMPSEEAAVRLEKMPDRKAIEVLRLLKGKTAGSILAAIKPERAARLTEQLLVAP
jgi:flagellar motility protein MotE (MotC chaperone)